jgi:hypothetical protein
LRQIGAEDRAGDDGDKCRELENAVAPGKLFDRQKLGKQAVFRGTKDSGLRAGQKNYRESEIRTAVPERKDGEEHRGDFEYFCADGDAALAVAVGQVAARHREKQEGNGEEIPDEKNPEISFGLVRILAKDKVNDKEFQAVIVEGALKLGDDEAPETAAPTRGVCRPALAHSQPSPWACLCCVVPVAMKVAGQIIAIRRKFVWRVAGLDTGRDASLVYLPELCGGNTTALG